MNQALEVFIKVAEEKNFSNAAKRLHMSQPAVSQYIRGLEEELGVQLLERTNKYVRLNKAGEIVYQHAIKMAKIDERMRHLVEDLSTVAAGKLAVGASYTFGEYILPSILARLKEAFPHIEVEVTIGNTASIAEAVSKHVLDIGIVEGHHKEHVQLHTEIFAEDQMVIFASVHHPLVRRGGKVAMAELQEQEWVLREEGSGTREAAENIFAEHRFRPATFMQFSSTQPIKAMIEAGTGVSVLSEWAIEKEVRHGELAILDVEGMPYPRKFSLVTNSHFQTKALSVFIDMVKRQAR
ncbi:LysR family transcriptional regulator [Planococcus maritimus]|uniref:LysR family transcriptional regulator n=1 Tax=Planococcus maritimus TaxID=192421 RepID=A0A7D7MGK8_PLAMR|nr:LysR family transcriptional regulator [Planococcus maritimus]QMT17311.1 LysR family transcriptional regulator [Planococcus maritimus]